MNEEYIRFESNELYDVQGGYMRASYLRKDAIVRAVPVDSEHGQITLVTGQVLNVDGFNAMKKVSEWLEK